MVAGIGDGVPEEAFGFAGEADQDRYDGAGVVWVAAPEDGEVFDGPVDRFGGIVVGVGDGGAV